MKHRGHHQVKPRKDREKRLTVKPKSIINIQFNGSMVVLLGEQDKLAWNAMNRQEKKKHVALTQARVDDGTMKLIEVEFEEDGYPKQKNLYVPGTYLGTGIEFLDLKNEDESIQTKE